MKESYAYKPVRFFLITNLIMWTAWLIAAYFSYQPSGGANGLISLLLLVGLFSPLVTALWMIFTSKSPQLKHNFYDRLLNLKLIKLWTIPAIFLIVPVVIIISVALSHLFFKQPLDQLAIVKTSPFFAGIIPAQLMLIMAPLIEEVGWKGYGVESLRGRRSFLTVTLMFAALWAFWHGPTFFVNGYYQNMLIRTNPVFALNFIVSFFPATIIFNWLWYKNRGSILTAVLCHGVIDFQGILQMGQIAKCIETIVLIIIAIVIVSLNKKMFFEEFPAQIGYFGRME
jgi:uncharacterized protein